MDLPGPNRVEDKPIIPEMNGPVQPPSQPNRVAQWVRFALAIVVVAGVLGLLVWGGIGLVHKVSHKSKTSHTSSTASNSRGASPSNPDNTVPAPANNNGSTTSGNQPSSAANKPAPGSGSTAAGNSLANTGPGSAATIFLLTTATGVIAYQVALRRKADE